MLKCQHRFPLSGNYLPLDIPELYPIKRLLAWNRTKIWFPYCPTLGSRINKLRYLPPQVALFTSLHSFTSTITAPSQSQHSVQVLPGARLSSLLSSKPPHYYYLLSPINYIPVQYSSLSWQLGRPSFNCETRRPFRIFISFHSSIEQRTLTAPTCWVWSDSGLTYNHYVSLPVAPRRGEVCFAFLL